NKKKEKKKKSKLRETVEFFIPIITAIMLALILKTFIFANAIVPTGSMISTINEGDRIIASRIAYIKSDPQRYDIILFKYPDDESQIFVKRVIGLPGEILEVVDGVAYVTGTDGKQRKTDQSFVKNQIPEGNYGPFYIPVKGETITTDGTNCFAENGMYVGGSNFINMYCTTDDSGNYVVAENCYFCMGDNRNSSWDSRFWDNTYVAENKIIGQAKFRYYPSFGSIE
ncbi:MAG: signal peptidase I, partial [Clostridiales bacterium]|nr:signal peptidase I [Clostridiales bacterium]